MTLGAWRYFGRMRILVTLLSLICGIAHADTVHVAVASNFAEPAKVIADLFEEETGHEVILSFGSSGKLYAQIVNGAPFDVFLSADIEKPLRLFEAGLSGEPFTYAVGRLVLWQKNSSTTAVMQLTHGNYNKLAIANPKAAPYGLAALETLETMKTRQMIDREGMTPFSEVLVIGENIAQAFQFVDSGNAELGFVALSQLSIVNDMQGGSTWIVPQDYHSPITQDAVRINDTVASNAFITFLQSEPIRDLISNSGYEVLK